MTFEIPRPLFDSKLLFFSKGMIKKLQKTCPDLDFGSVQKRSLGFLGILLPEFHDFDQKITISNTETTNCLNIRAEILVPEIFKCHLRYLKLRYSTWDIQTWDIYTWDIRVWDIGGWDIQKCVSWETFWETHGVGGVRYWSWDILWETYGVRYWSWDILWETHGVGVVRYWIWDILW